MNILSYRGPGKAGGVSGALARIFDRQSDNLTWWFLSDSGLSSKTKSAVSDGIFDFPESMIQGHYRHCNNFLWPVLHDMPERSSYSPEDRRSYGQFNELFAINALRSRDVSYVNGFFVQDYQLALLPARLSRSKDAVTNLFWHIPWPRKVERAHVEPLAEIAEALLAANKLGFHIEEYALNFMNFVRLHLREFEVDFDSKRIIGIKAKLQDSKGCKFTQVDVLPLGLDWQFWRRTLELVDHSDFKPELQRVFSKPFILSVDRADYTKGILQRIEAIDSFFRIKPELIGEISFIQVCQPSRLGLPQFDKYWQQTQRALHDLNNRWQMNNWQPIVWIAEPLTPCQLSSLYARATAMLVSPVRDGLNLTAKEFIACSNREDSLLLLSSGAGVWQELGDLSIMIEPHVPVVAAQQIATSLSLPRWRKEERMALLRERVQDNSLDNWWNTFTNRNPENSRTAIWASSKIVSDDYELAQDENNRLTTPTTLKE